MISILKNVDLAGQNMILTWIIPLVNPGEWQVVARQSSVFSKLVSITAAELEAAFAGIAFLRAYLHGKREAEQHFTQWHAREYADVAELLVCEAAMTNTDDTVPMQRWLKFLVKLSAWF